MDIKDHLNKFDNENKGKLLLPKEVLDNYDRDNPELADMRSAISMSYGDLIRVSNNNIQLKNGITQFVHLKPNYVHGSFDKKNDSNQSLNDKLSALF